MEFSVVNEQTSKMGTRVRDGLESRFQSLFWDLLKTCTGELTRNLTLTTCSLKSQVFKLWRGSSDTWWWWPSIYQLRYVTQNG